MGTLLEVDFRERTSILFSKLKSRPDLDVRVGTLAAGDYIIAREIVVERKTSTDFASSVIDARIFRQARRLVATRLRPLVLVEGEPDPRLHPHAWMGATLSLAVVWRVPVVCCRDADESFGVIRLLAGQAGRVGHADLPRAGYRPRRALTRKLFVLEGLPGVGPALARRLLERFTSIERVIEADEEELCCVAGIGPSKAAAIRAILR
jgi:DNA excision repair protein ERCC-4